MRAASASFDFTPTQPVYLNGYAKRHELSTGIHQPLIGSVLVIEDEQLYVLISFDLCGIDPDLTRRIAHHSGLNENQLFISATHTHASLNEFPLTLSFGAFALNQPNETIREAIAKQAADAIHEATQHLEAVRLYSKISQASGLYANRNDPQGPLDRFVHVLLFQTADEKNKGCIVHLNCHPTVLNHENTLISPDFVGTTRTLLEKELGCSVNMLNGACADVSTRFTRQASTTSECERIGQLLYERCHDLCGMIKLDPEVSLKHFTYPTQTCRYLPSLSLPISLLHLGNLVLLGFPGEITVTYAREIKECFGEQRVLVCGYTNDYLGYFICDHDRKDTYEAKVCTLKPEESSRVISWLQETLTNL